MVLTLHNPEQPKNEDPPLGMVRRLRNWMTEGIRTIFEVRIPSNIQEQGLTREAFAYINKRFYEIMKGTLRRVEENIVERSSTPFRDLLLQHGWHEHDKRAKAVLDQLIGEWDFRAKTDVVIFLKNHLTPLHGGVSWQ